MKSFKELSTMTLIERIPVWKTRAYISALQVPETVKEYMTEEVKKNWKTNMNGFMKNSQNMRVKRWILDLLDMDSNPDHPWT